MARQPAAGHDPVASNGWRGQNHGSILILLGRAVAVGAAVVVATGGSAAFASSPCGHTTRAPAWRHVVVIAFENHSYGQILGRSAPASYFKTLAGKCGSAIDYQAAHFPRSLPNYMAATGGRIVTTSDCLPGPGCESGGPTSSASSAASIGARSPSRCRSRAIARTRRCTCHVTHRPLTTGASGCGVPA